MSGRNSRSRGQPRQRAPGRGVPTGQQRPRPQPQPPIITGQTGYPAPPPQARPPPETNPGREALPAGPIQRPPPQPNASLTGNPWVPIQPRPSLQSIQPSNPGPAVLHPARRARPSRTLAPAPAPAPAADPGLYNQTNMGREVTTGLWMHEGRPDSYVQGTVAGDIIGRAPGYVPYQAVDEPSGVSAYNPNAPQYPRYAQGQGNRVSEAQWANQRPRQANPGETISLEVRGATNQPGYDWQWWNNGYVPPDREFNCGDPGYIRKKRLMATARGDSGDEAEGSAQVG
ncbi:hypothetical protein LTR37_012480 [Vermiconidia calcicola]|uniref:Uncharacterized protein n=1 Tax=Vermiconidia calcicola TaxID=1690605 RepID=A0ACC3N0J1_9PEZI|nr:hypothetical protein LTR37_012480 [Vermiconidia calcicola]